jgi:hypothetical protein
VAKCCAGLMDGIDGLCADDLNEPPRVFSRLVQDDHRPIAVDAE